MLNFNLYVRPQTAKRLKKALEFARDEDAFAQKFIAYQIAELRRAILNIRSDMKALEEKYQMSSASFYKRFQQGKMEDNEDFLLWAGLYEMWKNNKARLRGLEE